MKSSDHFKIQKRYKEAVEKGSEMLKFFLNHFKTRDMHQEALERFLFAFSCVPDQYMTQQMCESVILEGPYQIKFIPNQTQETCKKALDTCCFELKSISVCQKTSKIHEKVVNQYKCIRSHFFNWCKTQEISESVVSCIFYAKKLFRQV